jgi:uncharacterized spore protein YtfJ
VEEAGATGRRREIEEVADMARIGPVETIADVLTTLKPNLVFTEPYERDGVTVIPAAKVQGGAGGGGGEDPAHGATGGGSGFGLMARPAGAFIIRDGEVTWRPAVDVNRVILGGQIVAIAAVLAWRSVARAKARAGKKTRAAA